MNQNENAASAAANQADDTYEKDPAKVFFALRGLPKFPDPPDEISTLTEPGYLTATGPTCLIREVLIPPARHEACPEAIFDILEESRICQNAGQYKASLSKLKTAWKLWQDKMSWDYLHNGLDPDIEEARKKKEREQELKNIEDNGSGDIGNLLQEMKDGIDAANEQKRKKAKGDDSDDDREPEDLEEFDEEAAKVKIIEDMKTEKQEQIRLAKERMKAEDEYREDNMPDVGQAVETEFELFIWNAMGSVYQSMGNDLEALIYYWRAKQAHDMYINVSEKKLPPGTKATPAKGAGSNEPLAEQFLTDNPKLNLTPQQLRTMKVEALLPFDYCSPATALTYSNLGAACCHLKCYDVAMACFYTAQQIRFQCIPEESGEFVDIGSSLNNLGVCLHHLKRYKEAYAYFLSAEELFLERLHPIHPRVNAVKCNIEKLKPLRKQLEVGDLVVKNSVVKCDPMQLRTWVVEMTAFQALMMAATGGGGKKKKGKKGKKKKK
eukprot:CAMPEP_0175090254 /NCGR_PEP_ID=MMETSP0086_2-20121207/1233_1 /TAXON_ID=136419 /ORGANISM="Unknown Unknown, Strain D1" /LENGTH=493 /DNA_ID=CAMNT_0016362841 /DNA_START=31 /DNA_END=1512 /DNA_ORIENTATION=+